MNESDRKQFQDEAVAVKTLRLEWLQSKNFTDQTQIDSLSVRERHQLETAWSKYLAAVWGGLSA